MSDTVTDLEFWSTDPIVPEDVRALCKSAAAEIEDLHSQIADKEASFDVRWDADMRAIDRWHKQTGKTMIWPDHVDLVMWLLEQLEKKEAAA
jgi:hypothetical protein